MSYVRSWKLAVFSEAAVLRSDIATVGTLIVVPVILAIFMKSGVGDVAGVGGADFVVPGVATLFAFATVSNVAFAYFREHGWGTWERVRTLPVQLPPYVLGKTIPYIAITLIQAALLLGMGCLLLEMTVRGSWALIILLLLLGASCSAALGVLLVATTSAVQQAVTIGNVLAVVLGGIGGAFSPIASYPGWAQSAARATPQYWLADGLRDVISAGANFRQVAPNLVVLALFNLFFVLVVVLRLDTTAAKRTYVG